MAEQWVDLDFTGSQPVQEVGSGFDRVPQGGYVLVCTRADLGQTNEEKKPMIRVSFDIQNGNYPGAAYAGKRVGDLFVLPRPGHPDDSTFGRDRFHGLLVAMGAGQQNGAMRMDLNQLVAAGRPIVAELRDDSYERRGTTVTSSKPASYFAPTTTEASELMAKPLAVEMPAAAPAPAATPVSPPGGVVAAPPVAAPAVPAAPAPADPFGAVAPPPPAPAAPAPAAAPEAAVPAAAADEMATLFGGAS